MQTFQLLSSDLIEHVFSFMPYVERLEMKTTCKALSRCKSIQSKVDLSQSPWPRENGYMYDSKFIKFLQTNTLPAIEYLDISNCHRLTDIALEPLLNLHNLKILNLTYCESITSMGIYYISRLPYLEELYITGCHHIEDDGLLHISTLASLKILHFSDAPSITDDGIACISSNLLHLQELYISGHNLTENSFRHIATSPQLDTLRLEYDENNPIINLSHLEKLKSLRQIIYHTDVSGSFIYDELLISVSVLTQLRVLKMSKCDELTDTGVQSLSLLIQLQVLELNCCYSITDVSLLTLPISLKSLAITHNQNITNHGLCVLARLTKLYILSLEGLGSLNSNGIQRIITLKRLQALNLSWCSNITNATLLLLANLSNLTHLYIDDCFNITKNTLLELTGHLKKLEIVCNRTLASSLFTQINDFNDVQFIAKYYIIGNRYYLISKRLQPAILELTDIKFGKIWHNIIENELPELTFRSNTERQCKILL